MGFTYVHQREAGLGHDGELDAITEADRHRRHLMAHQVVEFVDRCR